MNKEQAIKVLSEMQMWRRGEGAYSIMGEVMPYSPAIYGEAIDYAIKYMNDENIQSENKGEG